MDPFHKIEVAANALEALGFLATEAPAQQQRRVELRPRDGAQEGGGGGGRGGMLCLRNARPILFQDLPLIQRTNEELSRVDRLFKEAGSGEQDESRASKCGLVRAPQPAAALELHYQAESKGPPRGNVGRGSLPPAASPAVPEDYPLPPPNGKQSARACPSALSSTVAVRQGSSAVAFAQAQAALIPELGGGLHWSDSSTHPVRFGRAPPPKRPRTFEQQLTYGLELVEGELQMQKQRETETEVQEMERGG
eukprot:s2370_g5.t1